MSIIRAEDPRPIKLMKSAWGKLYVSTQTDAFLPENIQLARKATILNVCTWIRSTSPSSFQESGISR